MKRLALALLPVALLATVASALPGSTTAYPNAPVEARPYWAPAPAQPVVAQLPPAPYTAPGAPSQPATQQAPPAPVQPAAPTVEVAEVPPLVVDKTQLVEALALIQRATAQAEQAVNASSTSHQQVFIQETINLLAGSENVHFKLSGQSAETAYVGVAPLLSQALTTRQAAEEAWVKALDERDAQLYLAGPGTGLPATTVTTEMGTAGLRPEEQAALLINRAILQAVEALRLTTVTVSTAVPVDDRGEAMAITSEEAINLMSAVMKMLQTAEKIVQIAISR